jgi:hypothetical protein
MESKAFSELKHPSAFLLHYFLADISLPVATSVAIKFGEAQVFVDEAAVACEIERWHLKHGALPASLDDLSDPSLPRDIINGEPLHYRLIDADNYVLYSVGLSGTDHGGKVVFTESGGINPDQGDWVWSTQPLD